MTRRPTAATCAAVDISRFFPARRGSRPRRKPLGALLVLWLCASIFTPVQAQTTDGGGLSQAQRRMAHEQTVGVLSRSAAANVVNVISKRMRAPRHPELRTRVGGHSLEQLRSFGDWRGQDWERRVYDGMRALHRDEEWFDTDFDFDLKQALRNSHFAFPFSDAGVTLWGTTAYTKFKGSPNHLEYDGDVVSGMVGVDGTTNSGWRLGLSLGYSEGGLDYDAHAATEIGAVDQHTVSAYPYLSWSSDDGFSAWLLGGYGFGEYDVSKENNGEVARVDGLSARHYMTAGGVEQTLDFGGGFGMALRGKGLWSHADVDGGTFSDDAVMPELSSGNWRLALENEIGRDVYFIGGSIRPYALVSARLDGGDAGDDEIFFDAGGGLVWKGRRLSMDLSMRTQINDGATEESSVVAYADLSYRARDDGRGLLFSVKHGMRQSGAGSSWEPHDFGGGPRKLLSWRPVMETEIGYGWALRPLSLTRAGVLKTYSRASFSDAERRHALGLGFEFGSLNLGLESGYQRRDDAKGGAMDALFKGEFKF